MQKVYGVVLVGCGHIGEEHIQDIYYRDDIRIAGVVDLHEETARCFARRFGAASYDVDYRRYLEDPSVDIFIIATYTDSHLPIMRDCVAHGKHVLCEKPMAKSLEDLLAFRREAIAAPVKVKIGHILRHNKTYIKAQEMIAEGLLGKPLVMRMAQNHHTMNWPRYKRLIQDTPPVLDCGVHYFDIMQWFTGARIEKVMGIKQKIDLDLSDDEYNYSMCTCILSDGSVGFYESGWGNAMSSGNLKEFVGPLGRIRIVYKNNRTSHQEEGDLLEFYDAVKKEYHTINIDADYKPMYDQLEDLVRMIEKDIPNDEGIEMAFSATLVGMTADAALRAGEIREVERL